MIKNYVAFDLETTGLDSENDYIIEIGALKVLDGKVSERFMEFLKPPISIPLHITQITGITNAMVGNAKDTNEIIRSFVEFCGDLPLIGHNIMFDYKFTKIYATNYGLSFEKSGIDTLKIAKTVHKEMPSRSLENLCLHYNIENQAAHRAYHDALATAKLYHILAHNFEDTNPELFQPQILQYKAKKSQPCTQKQRKYLEALCSYHNIQPEQNSENMTRSEMSKLIDQIISNYGIMHF